MDESSQEPKAARTADAHQSGSFLIRIWEENREIEGEAPKMRVFMRNLKTGEEHYLGDLDQLGDAVLRQFQQLGAIPNGNGRKK
ncbi:MAG TPA: hypothetical protein VJ885_18295 [Thermoanaerobaculia bacterium]|nr:hypothetical protein [Thermoanaerobaculia bacterium]